MNAGNDSSDAFNDYDDGKITNAIIAKFDTDDRLTLNANHGATLSDLSAATLSSEKVAVLDAYDNQ